MLKIVMLDTYPYKTEDFAFLQNFGQVELFEHTTNSEMVSRISAADIVLTNKTTITEEHLSQAPQLKYIGVIATGYNMVDTIAAKKYNIAVTNIPSYGTNSVAQQTFAIILETLNRVGNDAYFVKNGNWANSQKWCVLNNPWYELAGKTLGIIGFGAIGQKVAAIAQAFGMKVLVYTRTLPKNINSVEAVNFSEVLTHSDIISLHCPLTPETKNLIGAKEFGLMKKTAILINVSRGPLIDEDALFTALSTNAILAAGLDVLSQEPPSLDNKLCSLDNCVITPHVAWSSTEARAKILEITQYNIIAFLKQQPQNVVN